jgi:type VI secretion system protein
MFEKRLTERIIAGSSRTRLAVEPSAMLDDVLTHLAKLFNTRQGSVMTRPDFGMIDINDVVHKFPDAIAELRAEIKRQIETFEPRLKDVSVQHVPMPERPLSLAFNVTASLTFGDRKERVSLATELGDNGLMRVIV